MITQQIAATTFTSPKEIVCWMGAMQAQDYRMVKWAIGLRLLGITYALFEDSFNKGEILRTHVLRPTWHIVSAEDIYWMLELSAPQMKRAMKSRDKQLGLDEKVFIKSNSIITKALSGGKHLTRTELGVKLEKAKISTNEQRLTHLLFYAELSGIICSGKVNSSNQTYTLLAERVKIAKQINRDEALTKLAKRYFRSHCPATLEDFTWWSGLNITDAKHALEMIKKNFISETIKSKTYWFADSFSIPEKRKSSVYLLPAFDEFIISYKDRTAVLPQEHQAKAFTSNGIFHPAIVMNGKAIGLWKRNIQKDKVILEAEFFKKASKTLMASIEKKFNRFAKFLEKKPEVKFSKIYEQ
ncbi:winged helix DNA-binding domain-containing protein [Ginsengibacter hankyongi]|uniref:winged helix DNA-binding domain-containing protein n=1 Tax=Ginsengibacter hankyongi TaxID=2607284 RepID=UPI00192761AC|nr:winged helix DNA-binding domain-containing protein [Ginsengibacter hankyongi]